MGCKVSVPLALEQVEKRRIRKQLRKQQSEREERITSSPTSSDTASRSEDRSGFEFDDLSDGLPDNFSVIDEISVVDNLGYIYNYPLEAAAPHALYGETAPMDLDFANNVAPHCEYEYTY